MDLKKPGQRDEELRLMSAWLKETIPTKARLWVEMPYLSNGPGANQTVTIGMAETVGIVQAAAPWTEVHMVGQSTWKSQVCGNGRMKKDEVSMWLLDNHPYLFALCGGNQDQMDAMCIGLYGMLRSNGEIEPPVKTKKKARKKA
jgi:Holliday junction resolvasome RuvABC endonuclease subunit